MARYYEFELASLTTREIADIIRLSTDKSDLNCLRVFEIMQAHTNANLTYVTPEELNAAVTQFWSDFQLYSKDRWAGKLFDG